MNLKKLCVAREWKATFVCVLCLLVSGCYMDDSGDKSGKSSRSGLSGVRSETTEYTSPKCPDEYRVKIETSVGNFVVEVKREWSPLGADRFHDLVTQKFYDDCRFFRVLPNFMAQIGINGDPEIQAKWRNRPMNDDRVMRSNLRGWLSFATAGPGSRTCQIFINFGNNSRLNEQKFSPFGKVVEGMEVVDKINSEHGQTPVQSMIQSDGNAYLNRAYPDLDYIVKARIVSN